MLYLSIYAIFIIVGVIVAQNKNRNAWGWGIGVALFSPILLILLVLNPLPKNRS